MPESFGEAHPSSVLSNKPGTLVTSGLVTSYLFVKNKSFSYMCI